jgi:heptosyltransferase-3
MASYLEDAVPVREIRRALVTKLRHHGDVLLTSPLFSTLKRAAPHAEIDALVYRETAPMLENHPAINRIHAIDRDWKRQGVRRQASAEAGLIRELRSRGYDLLIHLTDHPRGATLARLLRPRFAVTQERDDIGWLWRSFTHFYRLPRRTPRHAVEANLDALRRLGIYPDPIDKKLVLVPSKDAHARVDALLRERGLADRAFAHAHPGSRWMFKCWTPDATAALYRHIVERGHRIVVTGAPDTRERAHIDAILANVSPSHREAIADVSGMLTLQELAALTLRARIVIGVDSAPMHIAAAMGTPTLALFGPSGEYEWGPWMVPSRVVVSHVHPCRPCGIDGCGGGKISECLTSLPAAYVFEQFQTLLDETSSFPRR